MGYKKDRGHYLRIINEQIYDEFIKSEGSQTSPSLIGIILYKFSDNKLKSIVEDIERNNRLKTK
jgi:hypothetical protein